jgi:hypothetical protein
MVGNLNLGRRRPFELADLLESRFGLEGECLVGRDLGRDLPGSPSE